MIEEETRIDFFRIIFTVNSFCIQSLLQVQLLSVLFRERANCEEASFPASIIIEIEHSRHYEEKRFPIVGLSFKLTIDTGSGLFLLIHFLCFLLCLCMFFFPTLFLHLIRFPRKPEWSFERILILNLVELDVVAIQENFTDRQSSVQLN